MTSRSPWRVVKITAAFICAGAIQGALIGILSLTPAWIGDLLGPRRAILFDWWVLYVIVVMATPMGAILGPVFGWILLKRAPLWRIVIEPTVGAIIGSWIAWPFMYIIPGQGATLLVVGAFLGAIAAVARLRIQGTKRPIELGAA